MPVFTSIGVALGVSATLWGGAAAMGTGLAVAGAVGYGAYKAVDTMGGGGGGSVDSRVASATRLTEEEANTAAKKRAFRSGVLYTSPTGLDSAGTTASSKLK